MADNNVYRFKNPEEDDAAFRRFFAQLDDELADVPPPTPRVSYRPLVWFLLTSFLVGVVLGVGIAKGLL